jgi:predicted DNA-binding transcriptional regulator AlpA
LVKRYGQRPHDKSTESVAIVKKMISQDGKGPQKSGYCPQSERGKCNVLVKHDISPGVALQIAPRGLSRDQAAAYIGVGVTLFDKMVMDGRMPPPKKINSRKVWDRQGLDEAFYALPDDGQDESGNPWDKEDDAALPEMEL